MIEYSQHPSGTPIELVLEKNFKDWRKNQSTQVLKWADRLGFAARASHSFTVPDDDGMPGKVYVGAGESFSIASLGGLPKNLPTDRYFISNLPADEAGEPVVLGWGMGSYAYTNYRKAAKAQPVLEVPTDLQYVQDEVDAVGLARDLINTPAADMLPHHLELAVRSVASQFDADLEVTTGPALLKRNMRTIYTVGQASASEPRLLDMRWGREDDPRVTLVGKGVCFDSGGLDLKSAANMRSMKKDMGGAATVLGLARLVMARKLPVRLRALIPAVENAVAGNAYRPGDVIRTYKGLSVEIGNTDAEGRLIMCDALALATEENPKILIDYATLTGAARSAVGTEIAAMFATQDGIAADIVRAGELCNDPVCRLPLYAGYRAGLRSNIADLNNIASFPEGGAITAALFLQHFVGTVPWVHFDINAHNPRTRPAHPEGGEAMGLRAVYRYLARRFS